MFLPGSQSVVTVAGNVRGAVKIWSSASGECLHALEDHAHVVKSAATSPDGESVITASSDCTAKVWSATSGVCQRTLEGHWLGVTSAVFSPDGLAVATASGDCTARIWCTSSGASARSLEGHGLCVNSVAFSPDGLAVATASSDGTAKIWSTASGECLHTLEGHMVRVDSVAFSPDGLTLLTAVFALMVAAIQLSIYSLLDGPKGGPGERVAHFFEFSFEILSAFITFSFCMDNKALCDRETQQLLSSQQAGSLLQANRVWLCVGIVQGHAEAAAPGSRLV